MIRPVGNITPMISNNLAPRPEISNEGNFRKEVRWWMKEDYTPLKITRTIPSRETRTETQRSQEQQTSEKEILFPDYDPLGQNRLYSITRDGVLSTLVFHTVEQQPPTSQEISSNSDEQKVSTPPELSSLGDYEDISSEEEQRSPTPHESEDSWSHRAVTNVFGTDPRLQSR